MMILCAGRTGRKGDPHQETLYHNFHFGAIGRTLGVSDKVLAQRLRELVPS